MSEKRVRDLQRLLLKNKKSGNQTKRLNVINRQSAIQQSLKQFRVIANGEKVKNRETVPQIHKNDSSRSTQS